MARPHDDKKEPVDRRRDQNGTVCAHQCSEVGTTTLPDDLIHEIMLRLPVRSLLKFKSVCKPWKALISSPRFANHHLQHSMANTQLFTSIYHKAVSCPVQSLFENPASKPPNAAVSLHPPLPEGSWLWRILGSCNGLLCLILNGTVLLWNPSIRVRCNALQIAAPSSGRSLQLFDCAVHGFGYDQVHDRYKLLVASMNWKCPATTDAKIYTFGVKSYTIIKDLPCPSVMFRGVFVSGTLNWITKKSGTGHEYDILSVDLAKESFVHVMPPLFPNMNQPLLDGVDIFYKSHPVLGVLRNFLCFSFDYERTHFDFWVMKEYGVQESWTKLLVIPRERVELGNMVVPMWISDDGAVLARPFLGECPFITDDAGIFLYKSDQDRLEYPINWKGIGNETYIYQESLVSPSDYCTLSESQV